MCSINQYLAQHRLEANVNRLNIAGQGVGPYRPSAHTPAMENAQGAITR